MKETALRIILPAFALTLAWLIFRWKSFRKVCSSAHHFENNYYFPLIYTVHGAYQTILFGSFLIIFVYTFLQPYYFIVGPIDRLNQPFINAAGVLFLKFSFVFLLLLSLEWDKLTFTRDRWHTAHMRRRFIIVKRRFATGLISLPGGLFITLSSWASLLLFTWAIIVYFRFGTKINSSGMR